MIKLSFGQRHVSFSKSKARAVIGLMWLGILCGAGFLVFLGTDSYDKARTRLTEQARSYAHLIAEHDRFGFTVADVILKDMLDHLTYDDFNGSTTPQRRQQVLQRLRNHRERLPGIASFTLIGADGIRRIGIVGRDFTDLSDREYFRAVRDGREFFISNVEDGRASGKPGIHVARRFTTPEGRFGGLILINLAADHVFMPFYKSLDLGKNYRMTLRDPQRILISYPKYTLSAEPPQQDALGDQLAAGRDHGAFLAIDPRDGLEKLTAFERLEGSNIFATVSLPTADALAEARMLATGAALSALACVLGALGATLAVRKAQALALARDEAVKAGVERKMLIRKLNTVVEDERKHISIEIHDVLNAMLVRVRFDSESILSLASQTPRTPLIDEIVLLAKSITKQANELYAQCRGIVRRLRPEILDVLGLNQAVDEMLRGYNRMHSTCRFTFSSSGDMSMLESSVSIAAYRLVQEALSNVVKHARATAVKVSLNIAPQQNTLFIVVADNGVGFDTHAVTPGIGIVGMRERVAAFNGDLDIRSGCDAGTELTASIRLGQCPVPEMPELEAQLQ